MSKYKIGDRVRVKSDLIHMNIYNGYYFIEDMNDLKGKVVTIIAYSDGYNGYSIKEDNSRFAWADEMFEPIDSTQYIVYVGHGGYGKEYAFEVPQELVLCIKKGMKVEVDTSKGVSTGITTTGIISGDGVLDMAKKLGASFPLKKVIKVMPETRTVKLKDIRIKKTFKLTLPDSDKIKKCYEYYKNNKCLDRNMVLNKDGFLVDGYVAYLVAKMFDIEDVEVVENG